MHPSITPKSKNPAGTVRKFTEENFDAIPCTSAGGREPNRKMVFSLAAVKDNFWVYLRLTYCFNMRYIADSKYPHFSKKAV